MRSLDASSFLDGLFAATRMAEAISEEADLSWQDERGRRARQIFFNNLATLQETLPVQLSAILDSILESDLLLKKSQETYHSYGQQEHAFSFHMGECRDEQTRSFGCSDRSRSKSSESENSCSHAMSLINRAKATSLHF